MDLQEVASSDPRGGRTTPQSLALSQACAALWMATLSLMTAFMQTHAPAHRYLIARKIAKNLGLLREQDCFSAECRLIFSNLSNRWAAKARQLEPRAAEPQPLGALLPS